MMDFEKADQPLYFGDVQKDLTQLKPPSVGGVASNEQNNVAVEKNITSPVLEISVSDIKRKLFKTEVEKTEAQRQILIREKELIQEIFEAKEKVLDAKIKLALARLETDGSGITFNDRVLLSEERVISRVYPDISELSNTKLSNTRQEEFVESQFAPNEVKAESSAPPFQPCLGLSHLTLLDRVTVHQTASRGLDEIYEVHGPDGSMVLRANLSLGLLDHLVMGIKKILTVDMFDDQAEKVLSFRPFNYGKMEMLMYNERACLVRRWPTFQKPVLTINDEHDQMLLKIKGPDKRNTDKGYFNVETLTKVRIGCINKSLYTMSPSGSAGAPSGVTIIDFPRDLDIRCKAAIIACNFLIITKDQAKLRHRKIKMASIKPYSR